MTERRDLNVEFLAQELSEEGKDGKQIVIERDFVITPELAKKQKAVKDLFERDPETGKIYNGQKNVEIALQNDPILNNYWPKLNDFNGQLEKHTRDIVFDSKNLDFEQEAPLWSDEDTDFVKRYLNQCYRLWPYLQDVNMAILSMGRLCRYNPIRQYLAGCYKNWDGVPRAENLFIEFLGVEDDDVGYAREVTKLWLIGGVKRIFEPGCKFDNVICLLGGQGIGKSTILAKLFTQRYFSDSLNELKSKDAKEALTGKWGIELAEGTFMNTTSIEQTKQFLAATTDNFRRVYDKYETEFKRHNVFAITSNNIANFLSDRTGNRRFWILECEDQEGERSTKKAWEHMTQEYRDQVWGEVVDMYLNGYRGKNPEKALRLEQGSAIEAYAQMLQNNNCYQSPEAEKIRMFLDMGLPEKGALIRRADNNGKQLLDVDKNPIFRKVEKGWVEMTPQERYLYFTMGDANGEHNDDGNRLTAVCFDMIKQECFGIFGTRNDGQLKFKYDTTMAYMKKDWVCLTSIKRADGKSPAKRLIKPYNVRRGGDVYVIREWGM